jgi:hypothetical protein
MPTQPAINDCVRVIIPFKIAGVFVAQTHIDFHLNGGFTFNQALANDVIGIVGNALVANNVDDALGTAVSIPEWELHDLDNPAHDPLFVTSSFAGGETSNLLPYNVAALVSLRTGFTGRSNRGRCYWFGYTEASSVGNVFNVTSQTNLAGAYTDIQVDIDTLLSGSSITVVSFTNASRRDVTSFNVESSWATQRNRLERAR